MFMNKTTKNSLFAIAIIVIIFVLIALLYQYFTAAPISADFIENSSNLLQNLNNIQNENLNQNTENKNNQDYSSLNNVIENGTQLTEQEQKAINIAKKEWIKKNENTDGLQFNVSIQSDGKYLITIYDIKTTRLIKGYVVDVNTEIVNEK